MLRWLKSNHQALTAVGAMVVGLAALYVAWDQARVMRAQQHGAVVPVLQIDGFIQTRSERRDLGLRIVNNGVGPAMIESVNLIRDGESRMGFDELIALMPEGFDRSWSSVNGRALAPGGEVEPATFIWARGELGEAELAALLDEWSLWTVEVCYCSVFDRCWTTTSDNEMRVPVSSCQAPDVDVFELFGDANRDEAASAEAEE